MTKKILIPTILLITILLAPTALAAPTFTKLTNPATLPTANAQSADWNADSTLLAVCHGTSPFISIYSRTGSTLTKISNPSNLPPNNCEDAKFSPNGAYLAIAHNTAPFMLVYSVSGTTFTKLSDPATPPSSSSRAVAWSPDNGKLSVSVASTPFVFHYTVSGSTVTKIADPASLPSGAAYGISYSPNGNWFTVGVGVSPFIEIYAVSGTTYTKQSNPASLPTSLPLASDWTSDSGILVMGLVSTPFIAIYSVSGSTFTKESNPATLPAGIAEGVGFSPNNNYVAIGHATTPFISIYERSGVTFTKLSNPSDLPTGTGGGVDWAPQSGAYLAIGHQNSPFMTAWSVSPVQGFVDSSIYLNVTYCNSHNQVTCESYSNYPASNITVNITGSFYQNGTTNTNGIFLVTTNTSNITGKTVIARLSTANGSIQTVTYNLSRYHSINESDWYNITVVNSTLTVSVEPNPGVFIVPNPAFFHINKTAFDTLYWSVFKIETSGLPVIRTQVTSFTALQTTARYPLSGPTSNATGVANHTGVYLLSIVDNSSEPVRTVPFVICPNSTTCQDQYTITTTTNQYIKDQVKNQVDIIVSSNAQTTTPEERSRLSLLNAAEWAYEDAFQACDCFITFPHMYWVLIWLGAVATIVAVGRMTANRMGE